MVSRHAVPASLRPEKDKQHLRYFLADESTMPPADPVSAALVPNASVQQQSTLTTM